jgi:hypothetical protein
MSNRRALSFLAFVALLAASPALAAADAGPAPLMIPEVTEPPCSTPSPADPISGELQPAALTIICGSCSEVDCAGKSVNTACFDVYGTAGRCGASVNRCSTDNRNFCFCQPNDPEPPLG